MSYKQENKKLCLRQVEQMLASSLPVAQWCVLNKVPSSTMYAWLKTYREENPKLDTSANNWIEVTRQETKGVTGLVKADQGSLTAPTTPNATVPLTPQQESTLTAQVIRLRVNDTEVAVPSDCAEEHISRVLKVVKSL